MNKIELQTTSLLELANALCSITTSMNVLYHKMLTGTYQNTGEYARLFDERQQIFDEFKNRDTEQEDEARRFLNTYKIVNGNIEINIQLKVNGKYPDSVSQDDGGDEDE